jgi:hypothetical protein
MPEPAAPAKPGEDEPGQEAYDGELGPVEELEDFGGPADPEELGSPSGKCGEAPLDPDLSASLGLGAADSRSDLSCSGLVTTPAEVV